MAYRDPVYATRVKPAGNVQAMVSDEDIDAAADAYAQDIDVAGEERIAKVSALQTSVRTRAQTSATGQPDGGAQLGYNPETGELYAYGKAMRKDGRTLKMLAETPNLPLMRALPDGAIPLSQAAFKSMVDRLPRETDFGGKLAEGALNSVGAAAAMVGSAVTGRHVENPLAPAARRIYENNALSEQLAWDDEAFDSPRGFVNAAGSGVGSVLPAIGAGLAGTAVGGPGVGLVAAGAVNAASAGGSQADQAYTTLLATMGELSEQELTESSPAYRDLRNAKMSHDQAMRQVAYEASMVAGGIAGLITVPETLLGGKLVANLTRKIPGIRRVFGDVQDGAAAAVNRGALGRLADRTPGLVRAPVRAAGVGVFEGSQEVVEAGLSQAGAADYAGVGSADPTDYMTRGDFGGGFATGVLFGALGGGRRGTRTPQESLAGSDLAAALTGEGGPPVGEDPAAAETGVTPPPSMPSPRAVQDQELDRQIELLNNVISERFGPEWGDNMEQVASRPEGRQLLGQLMGALREKEAAAAGLQQGVEQRIAERFPAGPVPVGQPSLQGSAFGDVPPASMDDGSRVPPNAGEQQLFDQMQQGEAMSSVQEDDGTRMAPNLNERRAFQELQQRERQQASEQNPQALPGGEAQALEAQIEQLVTQIEQRQQANPNFGRTVLGKRFAAALAQLEVQWEQAKLEGGPQGVMPYAQTAPAQLQTPMPPEAPADGLGVTPPPLVNPEPMSAGEAQARVQTQAERGVPGPVAGVDNAQVPAPAAPPVPATGRGARAPVQPAPDQGVAATTGEPAQDIAAQLKEVANPKSTKDTVFVAAGNEDAIPAQLPEGVRLLTRPGIGTLLTTDANKLARFRKKNLTDNDIAKLLAFPENKAQAEAQGTPVAVVAKNPDGSVPTAMVASKGGARRAVLEARKQAPKADVAVVPVEIALKDRAQGKAAEKPAAAPAAKPVKAELGDRGKAVRDRAKATPEKKSPEKAEPAKKVADAPTGQTAKEILEQVPEGATQSADLAAEARLGKVRKIEVSAKAPTLVVPDSLIVTTGSGDGPVKLAVQSIDREFQHALALALDSGKLSVTTRGELEAIQLRLEQMETLLDAKAREAEEQLIKRVGATDEGRAILEIEAQRQLEREQKAADARARRRGEESPRLAKAVEDLSSKLKDGATPTKGRPLASILYYLPLTRAELLQVGKAMRAQAQFEMRQGSNWTAATSTARRMIAEFKPSAARLMGDERVVRQLVEQLALLSDTQVIQMIQSDRHYLRENTLAKQLVRGPTEVAHVATRGEEADRSEGAVNEDMSLDYQLVPVRETVGKVAVHGDLPAKFGQVANHWLKILETKLGPVSGEIRVMSMPDFLKLVPSADAGSMGLSYRRRTDGGKWEVVLGVDWDRMSEANALEVLAHEFGHFASDVAFENATPSQQIAVYKAFARWRDNNKGQPITNILASRMPPGLAMQMNVAGITQEYTLSYSEWAADNVARWLLSNAQPLSVVDKFFANVAAVLRSVYGYFKTGKAEPEWQQLMDSLTTQAEARAAAPDVLGPTERIDAMLGEVLGELGDADTQPEIRDRIELAKQRRATEPATATVRPLREAVSDVMRKMAGGNLSGAYTSAKATLTDTNWGDKLNRALMSLKTLRDLERKYREDPDPAARVLSVPLTAWVKLKGEQATLSNKAQEPGNQALELANQLEPKAKAALERVMYLNTTHGIHSDLPLDHSKNKHLLASKDERVTAANVQRYIEARAAYEVMRATQVKSVQVYAELRDAFVKLHEDTIKAQIEQLEASKLFSTKAREEALKKLNDQLTQSREGPYFPTMRFGDWIVRVTLPAEVVRGANDEFFKSMSAARAEQRTQKALNQGAKVVIEKTEDGEFQLRVYRKAVYFFASQGEAKAARADIEAEVREAYTANNADFEAATAAMVEEDADGEPGEPLISEPYGKLDYFEESKAPPSFFLSELRAAMKADSMDPEVARHFESMYIESLPEFSFRKSLLPRQGILGADKNMLRSYVHRLSGAANRYATIAKGSAVNEAWAKISEARKTYAPAAAVANTLNESQKLLAKRMQPGLLNTASDVITDASSFFSLAFSPVYILMNTMQPAMVTTPILAGLTRPDGSGIGMVKAAKYLKGAYEDAVGFFGKRGSQDFVAELRRLRGAKSEGETLFESAQALITKFGKTDAERDMLSALLDRGTLDFSFLNSLEDAMRGGWVGQKWGSLMRMGMAIPQQVEAMNRVTTALAAHRMAVAELKMPVTNANEWADVNAFVDDMVSQTQLDYSKVNRPVMFNKAGWQIVLQFKLYMQGMYMLMARNAAAVLGPRRPGETDAQMKWRRRQGGRTLAYFFLTHAAMGGAVGITPLTAIPQAMLKMLALAGFGDDEEDKWRSGESLMRSMFTDLSEELLGKEQGATMATALERGLPAALLGVDLSDRLGMPMLWDSRYMGGREGDKPGDTMDKALIYIMGAPYSNAKRVANGLGDLADGNPRAINGLPAGLRGVARSVLYGAEGIVDRDGDQFMGKDDLDLRDLLSTATGITPTKVSLGYRDRSDRLDTKGRIANERTRLMQKYRTADTAAERDEVWREVKAFSETVPKGFRISREQLASSRAAKQQRDSGEMSKQDAEIERMLK